MNLPRPLILVLLAGGACASERYFGYSQQSEVLAPGQRELEAWATWRAGREDYYRRLDTRLELETGLADQLQGAFYLNFKQVTAYDATAQGGQGGNTTTSELDGVSLELKRRFSDSALAPLGSAIYTELSLNTETTEFELKAILDKQVSAGDVVAFNLFWEPEWDNAHAEHPEHQVGASLGWAHRWDGSWTVGLELWTHNVIAFDEVEERHRYENGALYGGPVAHYANQGFWATLTLMPQLTALRRVEPAVGDDPGRLELHDHERFQARLLVGYGF